MRKQTKLVAVLSAAALLAIGASMTSFAATNWQKNDDGTWSYYDKDGEMVTEEWQKDGSKWFYLDSDGVMLTDSWVNDDSYVREDGSMIVNDWKKTTMEDSIDDPDTDGDSWFYFGSKGKKYYDVRKKIGSKTYYFDADGKMNTGWYEKDGGIYYLGEEDEGGRAENTWLWLDKPGLSDEDEDDVATFLNCTSDTTDACDDEGWYRFSSNGQMVRAIDKEKVNGKTYYFNNHGQMLYEWINDKKVSGVAPASQSNPELDGSVNPASTSEIGHMIYANQVEEGWRSDGWYEIAGSKDTGTDTSTDWYYFKDGKAKKANSPKYSAVNNKDGKVYVARIKADSPKGGKAYFAFNEYGQVQTGLQYAPDDKAFYFFDENGYPKTGKVSNVECDDDNYDFYFNTTAGKNGQGYSGDKSGYLYFNGKKLSADDEYRLFFYNDKVYLVNNKGKIQKSDKAYNIENDKIDENKVSVTFNADDSVKEIQLGEGKGTKHTSAELLVMSVTDSTNGTITSGTKAKVNTDGTYDDTFVSIPFIQLYDNDVYSYQFNVNNAKLISSENWFDVNNGNKWN